MMLFKKFTNENASEKVTVKERLAYGCGDFSSNIMYSAMAAFLLFYYTDVVGVSAAAVGVIMMCSRLWVLSSIVPSHCLVKQGYGFSGW